MDSIKEIFEAMGQRIRSPFWGYVFLSFVFLNWKPLYYLVFSDTSVPVKFRFFDLNTDPQSLYVLPLAFGLLATLLSPYISEYAALWATKPINRKRLRDVDAAHQVLQSKNIFAAERENQRAIYEQGLIDQAKRDEQIDAISDPDLKREIMGKVEESRDLAPIGNLEGLKTLKLPPPAEKNSDELKYLITTLAQIRSGTLYAFYAEEKLELIHFEDEGTDDIAIGKHNRSVVRYSAALEKLEQSGSIHLDDEIIDSDLEKGNQFGHALRFRITDTGYDLADKVSDDPPF